MRRSIPLFVFVTVLILLARPALGDGIHQDLTDVIPPAQGPDEPGLIAWEGIIPAGYVITWSWTANGSIDFELLSPRGKVLVNMTDVVEGKGGMDVEKVGIYSFRFINRAQEVGSEVTYSVHAAEPEGEIVSLEVCLVTMMIPIVGFAGIVWLNLRRRKITFRQWLKQVDGSLPDEPRDRIK